MTTYAQGIAQGSRIAALYGPPPVSALQGFAQDGFTRERVIAQTAAENASSGLTRQPMATPLSVAALRSGPLLRSQERTISHAHAYDLRGDVASGGQLRLWSSKDADIRFLAHNVALAFLEAGFLPFIDDTLHQEGTVWEGMRESMRRHVVEGVVEPTPIYDIDIRPLYDETRVGLIVLSDSSVVDSEVYQRALAFGAGQLLNADPNSPHIFEDIEGGRDLGVDGITRTTSDTMSGLHRTTRVRFFQDGDSVVAAALVEVSGNNWDDELGQHHAGMTIFLGEGTDPNNIPKAKIEVGASIQSSTSEGDEGSKSHWTTRFSQVRLPVGFDKSPIPISYRAEHFIAFGREVDNTVASGTVFLRRPT